MDIVEFESECIDDECIGTIHGTGYADEYGEIIKFIFQQCNKCDWWQSS